MDEAIASHKQCYIIMEQCDRDLLDIVSGARSLTEDSAQSAFCQMAQGLLESHVKEICHHDVKLENFLVSLEGEIKLSDFGYSLQMDDEEWTELVDGDRVFSGRYNAGSPAYSSLQVLKKESHSGISSDIFSLGVCLYRLICGKLPFCDLRTDTMETLIENIEQSRDQSKIDFPDFVSEEIRELICGMLAADEQARWGWESIIDHPWCFGQVHQADE
eukprot:TRINITY_DN1857_c1_g1_i1.p1 TRINITY_DN1857_c1_g1~~TRINITY_DN1857_c1_g1_i1.p1  ORF type:complete len:217 (+),score=88.20 TRINITY_DN1857_c1_g1_i1:236-886(+)